MLSVTADTNIYISALNFGGLPRRFLNLMEADAPCRLAISGAILAEIGNILRGKKFGWSEARIASAQEPISRFAERVTPVETLHVIAVDDADNRILECAAAANSDYIVTGDDHLLRLREYRNTRILKVAEFLEVLRGHAPG